jgi:sulfoquinovosyltransferase
MRSILTDGHPESPLIIYVGRLGMEKRLVALKRVLKENPSVRLAFVGKVFKIRI